MSYLRGEYYFWQSEGRTHFWAADGYDGWDETGWGEEASTRRAAAGATGPRPSGVGLPQTIVDAYVMLRLAQLVREGRVGSAVAEALARGTGNFGATDLAELGPAIVSALAGVAGESAER